MKNVTEKDIPDLTEKMIEDAKIYASLQYYTPEETQAFMEGIKFIGKWIELNLV